MPKVNLKKPYGDTERQKIADKQAMPQNEMTLFSAVRQAAVAKEAENQKQMKEAREAEERKEEEACEALKEEERLREAAKQEKQERIEEQRLARLAISAAEEVEHNTFI